MANEIKTKFGQFGTIFPKKGEESSNLLGPIDKALIATDILGPTLYEASQTGRTRKLREGSEAEFEDIELSQPGVRGLRPRNFAMPSRAPTGSTLDSQVAEKLFRDAFQQSQENVFNVQDEAFRQAQRDRNVDIENKERMINVDTANRQELVNTTRSFQELMGDRLPDRRSNIESLFFNINKDLSQVGLLKGGREISSARNIILNQGQYSEEQVQRAKEIINSSIGLARNGKKLTKFSTNG